MPINGYEAYVCFNCVVKLLAIFSFILEQLLVQYIQKLPLPAQSAQHILMLLQQSEVTGLVFLNNKDQPIIGFNPATFCIFQDHQLHYYKRDESNQYIEDQDNTELTEFIIFQNSEYSTKSINSKFQGGYIGFIGYDYAASQYVNTDFCVQPALYVGKYQIGRAHV